MAIHSIKRAKGSANTLNNEPEYLVTIPENNIEHTSAPEDFHIKPICPCKVYKSFNEAKQACERIYLKPGEAHTEFYEKDGVYHCVVAIGNAIPNTEHLYLTDSGNEYSIDDRLDQMYALVMDTSKWITKLNKDVKLLSNDVSIFENNINNIISEILIQIENFESSVSELIETIDDKVDDSLTYISDISNRISSQINDISLYVSNFDSRISKNASNIDFINSSINSIENELLTFDNNIRNIESSINDINVNINIINSSIESINSSINNINFNINIQNTSINNLENEIIDIKNDIDSLENKIYEHDCSILQLSDDIVSVNASISSISEALNEFQPIGDSSIYPLFHDDIYTINLCCYSKGGYIQIEDHIAGINAGGTNTRVAECTPFNKYKTYVHGDTITLTAVENRGYRFICWYKDGNLEPYSYNKSINYTFGNDVNVIGSLLDGVEPEMLNHGYTAKFKKLHRLTVTVDRSTNTFNTVVQYFNDILTIHIDDVLGSRDISMEDAAVGNAYYDDGATIRINATPDAAGHHQFLKYIVYNGSATIEYTNTNFVDNYVLTDMSIKAFFRENWIRAHADASPSDYGNITIIGEYSQESVDRRYVYYLDGTQVILSAIPNNGYRFITWTTDNNKPSIQKFELDIYPYTLIDEQIILNINREVDIYEITAKFEENSEEIIENIEN